MQKGTLIEFRLHGDRRIAVADRPDGKKNWFVVDGQGQSYSIPPKQVSYEGPDTNFKPSEIPQFMKEVEPYLDPASLEIAWELLVEDSETVDPAGLAQILFSGQDPAQCYAAYYLLSNDKLYFKQKGDRYEPRPVAQVAEIKHQQEVERQRQNELQGFLERVKQSLAGTKVEWQATDRMRLETLERYALFGEEATHRAQAIETLNLLERADSIETALQVLIDLKWWSQHENLFIRRSQIPIHFSNKVIDVANSRLSSPPPDLDADRRLDLTHLKVYTIDDESTTEIDDGLSLEFLPDGQQKLWIHIADPTRLMMPGDELELEARKRSTTLYLPTGMIPMFPLELATGPMSLIQGKVCAALSFAVILEENGSVKEYSIHPSLIKPTYRLTYDDVNEMLELGVTQEPEISAIESWAKKRQKWRESQGAISIYMPEAVLKVKDDEINIYLVEDTNARLLVAEMMILAGEIGAHYGLTHNIPLPYRGQPQPELPPPEELLLLPPGPVRSCAIRRCMPRSEIATTPFRHASLGLDHYVQVTSPIRRYSDLLSHFQIKAHLRGDQLPFTREYLQEIIMGISLSVKEAVSVERQTNRYWGLEYLRRQGDKVWQALVLRWLKEDGNIALILLEDLGLELGMRLTRNVEVGDRLEVRVSHADPRHDEIHFQEMLSLPAQ